MLSLHAVRHAYGSTRVLDGLDITLAPGEVLGLIGPSGCGKTTTLHLAAGLLRPTGGRIQNRFRRTALVFQEPRLLPWQDAIDNAAFGLKAVGRGRAERRAVAADLLARLGLETAAMRRPPHALSGGMRQRVGLARALAVAPDLLLLDEPFAALDVGLRRELQSLLRGLIAAGGLAAVVVTHDVVDAFRLCDRIAVLAPAQSRVVHEARVARAGGDVDEADLHERAAAFLRVPAVAAVFAARVAQ